MIYEITYGPGLVVELNPIFHCIKAYSSWYLVCMLIVNNYNSTHDTFQYTGTQYPTAFFKTIFDPLGMVPEESGI